MTVPTLRPAILGTLAAGLLLPSAAGAQVFDTAGLVRADTVSRANQRIQALHDKTGIRLVFDIAPAIPDEFSQGSDGTSDKERRAIVERWIDDRIREAQIDNGLYVLLCLDPELIEIRVWPRGNTELFNNWYQRELRRRIIAYMQRDFPDQTFMQKITNKAQRRKTVDDGLIDVVKFTCAKLAYNRPVDQTVWYWSLSVIGIVLGGCAVLGGVRARLRKSTPPEAGVFGEEASGRSVAVLGGGIGAVASQWLLAVLFKREREPEIPSPIRPGTEAVAPGLPRQLAERELDAADDTSPEKPAPPGAA